VVGRRQFEDIDWRIGVSKWMLLLALTASIGFNALLGTMVTQLLVNRFQMIEARQKDPIWTQVSQLSYVQADQGAQLRLHEESLRELASLASRMAATQVELRALNDRLLRKGL
jgi:hypothetical protein